MHTRTVLEGAKWVFSQTAAIFHHLLASPLKKLPSTAFFTTRQFELFS